MKKSLIISVLLAFFISMTACSQTEISSSEIKDEVSVQTEAATENETSEEETTTKGKKTYDYVHGEEGYYNIADEMPGFEMKSQQYGTCWLYAAAAGMETAYFKENGSYISLDPLELLEYVYGDDKDEGFFVRDGVNEKELGGWQWMVTERLTSGFDRYAIESSVILDSGDREAIKENLRTRGAVSAGIYDMDDKIKGWFGEYYTMNDEKHTEFDHDVTIIGYDDNFPKEYFKNPASDNGAWITYNSSLGSAGFYYISYCTNLEYAISHSVTDKYSDVLSYDAGNEQDRYVKTGDGTITANVFHKAGKLGAVGTYNAFDRQNINIEIYDSTFTYLLYSQDAVLDYHGYHTIELDEPVEVEDFAVIISYEKGAPVEGETIDYGETEYRTVSEKGQSLIYLADWKDMTDSNIKETLGIDFEPNNCCIKALFIE